MRYAAIARMIGMSLLLARVSSCQVDERCPSVAYEQNPKLLSSLEPVKAAARSEGCSGRLLFRLTVTEVGSVHDPVITYSKQCTDANKIKDEIRKLRFCPAVRYSRYTAREVNFDVQTE